MDYKKININDRFAMDDGVSGGLQGEIIVGRNKTLQEFTDPYGNKSYRTKFGEVLFREKNIIPIGSYQFVFSKLFNIALDSETTLRVGDLNEEAPQMKIGVPKPVYKSTSYNAEVSTDGSINGGVNISALNFIFGFMCGDGGAKEDNITAIAPDYKRRTLYHAIPFRMNNDGTRINTEKYFGKYQDTNGVVSYYVKKFDEPAPHIVHSWVTDGDELDIVDDSVYSSTSTVPIESYIEVNFSINGSDGKGYFTQNGSTPRINEIALVSGWYNNQLQDFESIRMASHFTRSSIVLDENDGIEAVYRIYAR